MDAFGYVNACKNDSEPGRLRCKHCGPDGAKLDRNGRPVLTPVGTTGTVTPLGITP